MMAAKRTFRTLGPEGDQMDFMEVMEINNGLIIRHRIYWGWLGVNTIINDAYYR
jgi:hypothetical protein